MEDTPPDSPRLSFHQDELFEGIKFCREEIQKELQRLPTHPLDNLSPKDLALYYEGPEFSRLCRLQKDIDRLTVKAIRSLWRRVPGKEGYPGICMKFIEDKEGNYEISYVPGDSITYHPGLPRWVLEHCCLWIHDKRWIRSSENYYLLAECKMGFETGLQEPMDYDLLERVLQSRGFDMHSEKGLKKIQKKDKTNKNKRSKPKKRVRKESHSWDKIASQLGKIAKPGTIPTTGEGLKIMLQKMFPHIDFDKI
jgi:hypothetical protein